MRWEGSSRTRPFPFDPHPPFPPPNANVLRILLSFDGAILMLFDGPVAVDQASPPTTWAFHGNTSLQAGGGFNFTCGTYLVLNGVVNPGDPVVLGPLDPAARTPGGGYVNGGL